MKPLRRPSFSALQSKAFCRIDELAYKKAMPLLEEYLVSLDEESRTAVR